MRNSVTGCVFIEYVVFAQIAFYGLGLNSSIVLEAIGFATSSGKSGTAKVYEVLKNVCVHRHS